MRAKLQPLFNAGQLNRQTGRIERQQIGWAHWCPACDTMHAIKFDSGWKLTGDYEKPCFDYTDRGGIAIMYGENPWIPGPNGCTYKIIIGHISYTGTSAENSKRKFRTMTVPLPLWDLGDLMPKPRSRWRQRWDELKARVQTIWLRLKTDLP